MLKMSAGIGLLSSYLLLGGGLAASFSASAVDNMRLHGALVYEACDIQPGDENQTLELGLVADRYLYLNTSTPPRALRFNLINCDTGIGNMVTLSFSGAENSQLPGYLAVDGSSTAAGIAVGITTNEGQLIPLNDTTGKTYPLTDGSNVITIKGYLRGEPDALANHTITRGPFSAVATFNLDYN